MTVLGKVIGGGMPVAAFGGKREIMKHLAPLGRGLSGRHGCPASGRVACGPGNPERAPAPRVL